MVIVTCANPECGKAFNRNPSKLRKERNFCSKACYYRWIATQEGKRYQAKGGQQGYRIQQARWPDLSRGENGQYQPMRQGK